MPHNRTEYVIDAMLVTKHLSRLLVTCSLNLYSIDPNAQLTVYGLSMKKDIQILFISQRSMTFLHDKIVFQYCLYQSQQLQF